ncbi:hypothetical protein BD413DRAFT_291309 [Trametes elegans]|nr:hypothetical protein BD413DRAFT_291309 [Trametes elegans]
MCPSLESVPIGGHLWCYVDVDPMGLLPNAPGPCFAFSRLSVAQRPWPVDDRWRRPPISALHDCPKRLYRSHIWKRQWWTSAPHKLALARPRSPHTSFFPTTICYWLAPYSCTTTYHTHTLSTTLYTTMSAPTVIPTCTIIVHAPPTVPSPRLSVEATLGTLSRWRGPHRSSAFISLGSVSPVLSPTVEYLLPSGASSTPRRRRTPYSLKSSRGRTLDPWKLVPSSSSGQSLLVAVPHPDDRTREAAAPPLSCSQAALLATARTTTAIHFNSSTSLEQPASASSLVGYKNPGLIPYIESAFYLAMIFVYAQCTLIPLLL